MSPGQSPGQDRNRLFGRRAVDEKRARPAGNVDHGRQILLGPPLTVVGEGTATCLKLHHIQQGSVVKAALQGDHCSLTVADRQDQNFQTVFCRVVGPVLYNLPDQRTPHPTHAKQNHRCMVHKILQGL